jgi:hypothetical protein
MRPYGCIFQVFDGVIIGDETHFSKGGVTASTRWANLE